MAQTIPEAITDVLRSSGGPLSSRQVYERICERGLYTFQTANPLHVVTTQLRRHCDNLHFASAKGSKLFTLLGDGRYTLIGRPGLGVSPKRSAVAIQANDEFSAVLEQLVALHQKHVSSVRSQIVAQLRGLTPTAFERFARHLIAAYGFTDISVTRPSKDGGIDGHGRLPVGMTHLRAAFQCKNWKASIGRPEVDRFRGAIQGRYEQGVMFITSTFTKEAQKVSFCPGAVPVVLFSGEQIAQMMIDRRVGMETEYLPLYGFAIDSLLE